MMEAAPPPVPRVLLRQMFDAAIASAQPALCIPPHLPSAPRGRLIVIGAGKASAAMARSVEQHWAGLLSGLVVTRYGYAVPCEHIEIAESAHPVPDAAGLRASQRMMELVKGLNADDLVLCLISGASRRARSTGSGTLRLAVGRRDDGDCARQRTRRAKRGISAVPRHCTQWSPAYPWAGGGHGWCRPPRGNCRRTDRTGFDRTRLGPRLSAHGNTGRQRCA